MITEIYCNSYFYIEDLTTNNTNSRSTCNYGRTLLQF